MAGAGAAPPMAIANVFRAHTCHNVRLVRPPQDETEQMTNKPTRSYKATTDNPKVQAKNFAMSVLAGHTPRKLAAFDV